MQHNSITIVGGGPVGMTAALKLAKAGNKVTVLDEFKVQAGQDGRVLSLSHASMEFLAELGINLHHLGSPIDEVHLSHNGLGVNRIKATDINLAHLGYTVKYTDLIKSIYQLVPQYPQISLQAARVTKVTTDGGIAMVHYHDDKSQPYELSSELAILAEGGNVMLDEVSYREHSYNKYAVIARIKTRIPPAGCAYQRFEQDGLLALLPHHNEYVVVWVLDSQIGRDMTELELRNRLQQLPFMRRFNGLETVSGLAKFPLRLKIANTRVINDAVVLIGSSAQIVHPVSAQGLNLGLRDVRDLCELLVDADNIRDSLASYAMLRKRDVEFVGGFTHFMAKFVEMQNPLMNHLRGLGIMTLGNCKWLQNKLTHSLVFGI
jgi:2-octaprenyl-6-methoxyphenol hydroxylase